jgi:hypothetical protein
MSQGETLKTTGDGIKKLGEQNKAVINLKIPNPSLRECPKTPLYF